MYYNLTCVCCVSCIVCVVCCLLCGVLCVVRGSRAAGALAAACSSVSVAERERGLGALRVILKEEVQRSVILVVVWCVVVVD